VVLSGAYAVLEGAPAIVSDRAVGVARTVTGKVSKMSNDPRAPSGRASAARARGHCIE
jgi:hypothetical protein